MAGFGFLIDPRSESATNIPLELSGLEDGAGIQLLAQDLPAPEPDSTWASSADTEGEILVDSRYLNRGIAATLRVQESGAAALTGQYATNPSGELAVKFSPAPDFAITRELGTAAIPARYGEYRDKHAFDGSGSDANGGGISLTFVASGTWCLSMFVWVPSSWDGAGTARITTDSTYAGATETVLQAADLAKRDMWQRISTRLAVVGGDLAGTVLVRTTGGMPSTAPTGIYYSDGLQIELGSNPTDYFDGDTPGCAWTGTAHSSTSTRPAADGTRFYEVLQELQGKVAKISREGGTLRWTPPAGDARTFDLLEARLAVPADNAFAHSRRATCELELVAKPFARGVEVSGTDKAETTLPVVIQTGTAPEGDVPAAGRLLIDEDDADTQRFVIWGLEVANYDAADPTTKKLFYEAEDLYATGGAAPDSSVAGASGAAADKTVVTPALGPHYVQVLSMKASTVAGDANGSGSYPAHVGTFNVYARVWTGIVASGDISIRLEWGQGDFGAFTENEPWVQDGESALRGKWVLADLGQVHLTKVLSGTQQWDGRIAVSTTSALGGDTIAIDYVMLVPVAEASGKAYAVDKAPSTAVAATARDSFDTHAVTTTLIGKTPPTVPAGTWTESGDTDDYTIEQLDSDSTDFVARRVAVSDSALSNGCFARCGSSVATNTTVTAVVTVGTPPTTITGARYVGVFARYVDTSNWLFGGWKAAKDGKKGRYWQPLIVKRVAGTLTTVAEGKKKYGSSAVSSFVSLSADTAGRVTLTTQGSFTVQAAAGRGVISAPTLTYGPDAVLATAGALDDGGYGIYDANTSTQVVSRYWDDFLVTAASVTPGAAIYASQSLEIRSDRARRENSAGTIWQEPGRYEGDYVTVPPTGLDGRSYRMIVKASRGLPGVEEDAAIDNLSAQLHMTPRYLGAGD